MQELRYVSGEWLCSELRASSPLMVVDCRAPAEYRDGHVRCSLHVSFPSIMLRRAAAGKMDAFAAIRCRQLRERLINAPADTLFVLYTSSPCANSQEDGAAETGTGPDPLGVLARRLLQDGRSVYILLEGYASFCCQYPEWTESAGGEGVSDEALLSLASLSSLRISSSSSTSGSGPASAHSSDDDAQLRDRSDSSLGLEVLTADGREGSGSGRSGSGGSRSGGTAWDLTIPVEILPCLFLGDAHNSEDRDALKKHHIEYILNVTPDLPNVFEREEEGGYRYLQIPISDHWSQNLASFFPAAIEFIDEARRHDKGVLVHCLAGVSRSVTVTMAYLMFKLHMGLNEAYDFVRRRKADIAPNFTFLGQLLDFERQLSQLPRCPCETPCSCPTPSLTHFLSPLPTGTSPDSGIEFDRWASSAGPE